MMLFARKFLKRPEAMNDGDRADYNQRVGREVDDFRTFVNTHYMTERDDTPFWREVREHRIHPETKERLALPTGKRAMPHMADFPGLSRRPATHVQTQLHYPVLEGLGLLRQDVAREEMERDPEALAVRRARRTRRWCASIAPRPEQALGHWRPTCGRCGEM